MKPYFVTSLWGAVDKYKYFEKDVIFQEFDFKTSDLEFEISKSSIHSCDKGVFSFIKKPCHTNLCAFRWLISRLQILNLRFRDQICGKLLLSQKLCHFRGSCFSQSFIPSTSPHNSSPRKVLCL